MNQHSQRFAFTLAAFLLAACGRNETVASKSAEALREAQAKGTPLSGGHDHGQPATASVVDHSAHGTSGDPHAGHAPAAADAHAGHAAAGHAAAPDAHAGHNTGATSHAQHGTTTSHAQHGATTSHAQHGASSHAQPGVTSHAQHGTAAHAQHGTASHAQHGTASHAQHGTTSHAQQGTASHAQHGTTLHAQHGTSHAATPPPAMQLDTPRTNAEIARTRPASTLQPDAFDAAAPVSVEEARRATAGGHGNHGGSAAGQHEGHGQQSAALYVCPMHPEVTSATPANCPKCGMALVKKE